MNNINNLFELVELQENINSLIESSLDDLNNNELEVLIESASPYAYNSSQEPHMSNTTKLGIAAAGFAAIKSRKGLARFVGGKLSKYGSKVKVPKVPKSLSVKVPPTGKTPPALPKTWGPNDYEQMMTAKYGPAGSTPKPITPSAARPAAKPPALPKQPAAKPPALPRSSFENDIDKDEFENLLAEIRAGAGGAGMVLQNKDLKPVDLKPALKKFLDKI